MSLQNDNDDDDDNDINDNRTAETSENVKTINFIVKSSGKNKVAFFKVIFFYGKIFQNRFQSLTTHPIDFQNR